jgi:hypothetical protein
MTKIAGSRYGSLSQRHGSADPDPYKNVMDPQHCPAGCDFERYGQSMLPALTDHTACPGLYCSAASVWQFQLLLVCYKIYTSNRHDGNHAWRAA